MASVTGGLDAIVAHMPGVRGPVRQAAEAIAARARGNLAGHHVTGRARIVVEPAGIDMLVVLDDPASLSIEFGRGAFTRSDGRYVGAMEGLHVLSRAVR